MLRSKKTRWPVVIVGVVLAAILGSLGTVQARQSAERSRLDAELAVAEESLRSAQLVQTGAEQSERKERLSTVSADLEDARAQLSEQTDSIIANEVLFNIARLCGVTLTEITVSPVTEEDLEQVPCSLLPVSVKATGNMAALVNFIMTLNTTVTNGVVRSARATAPDSTTSEPPSAQVRLVIYSYQGE